MKGRDESLNPRCPHYASQRSANHFLRMMMVHRESDSRCGINPQRVSSLRFTSIVASGSLYQSFQFIIFRLLRLSRHKGR